MKKTLFVASLSLLLPAIASAQNSGSLYDNLGYILVGGAVLLIAIFAVSALIKVLDVEIERKKNELGLATKVEGDAVREERETWWKRMYKDLTDTVPVSREKEILLDHNYDGIKELDNNLPPWWLAMFYVSIVFGVFYMGYHHFSKYGISSAEEYEQEMAMAQASVDAFLAGQTDLVDENNVTYLTDETSLKEGEFIYQLNCVPCHLTSGGGLVGPNLTDDYWIHGGGIKNIFKTVKYGVPEKGMIAWSAQLRPPDIQKVSSYIMSLGGTNPADGKAAEGELWTEDAAE